MDRLELVGHSAGNQALVAVLQKEGITTVLFASNTSGKAELYRTVYKPFEEPKTDKVRDLAGGGTGFVTNGGKHFLQNAGKLYTLGLDDAPKSEEIALNYTFRRSLGGEFSQIFEESWAEIYENYYDERFHGRDWKALKAYYGKLLPYLNNRNDLRILINDMLGELNSSHLGFNSAGDDEKTQLTNATMETGILFNRDRPYEVDHVVYNTPADKVNLDIRKGDVLTEVNGEKVDPDIDRYFYFTNPSIDKELSLVFMRGNQRIRAIVRPKTDMINELYDEWIETNQELVDRKTNKQVAYTAMKNMGKGELDKFIIDMTQELLNKRGLIIDLRYNTGGNVHDEVLKFLSQRSYLQWKYREGNMTRQPNFAPSDNPIVLLINEQSLSDAEMTAQGFKALKLGKIVGNETYRWIIFTSGVSMVDGSTLRMPSWGCYTLEGKDLERTGVAPDIRIINTFQDKLTGRDPQLERAIKEVLSGGNGK
jgi:C-terminal processing protease CtpA/Prc